MKPSEALTLNREALREFVQRHRVRNPRVFGSVLSGKDRSHVPEYLRHILQAIERIGDYTTRLDETAFLADLKTQDAVIRSIEIIGETARNVERAAPDFAAQHPEVPWAVIYAMRNRVSHVISGSIWRSSGKRSATICRHFKVQIGRLLTK